MVEVQDAASLIMDTLQLIYDTPKLRSDIDDSFDADVKIPAIKHLKVWCENTNYPAWCEDVNLRICRDTIDIYYNRKSFIFSCCWHNLAVIFSLCYISPSYQQLNGHITLSLTRWC